ncbi:MAG: PP2C family serine/threonine-protein phosphatase [Parachlamydiaceae bacterium]|nr:PP2C family serine/threonine-protein phosphatase [Parachlamydiaceae bacterium]
MFLENNNVLSPQVNLTNSTIESVWKPRELAVDIAAKKMWVNSRKAIEEHYFKAQKSYVSCFDVIPRCNELIERKLLDPFNFIYFSQEAQGIRSSMEDAHFFEKNDQGVVCGVFDGHGGYQVASFICNEFKKFFFIYLSKFNGNIHQTFECLFEDIHNKVAKKKQWNKIGSTAVLCFIDPQTHLIYTATVGDSEANIYRKINGQFKSIPLSCVRDWSCKKEAKRASIALNDPTLAERLPHCNPKKIYFSLGERGINLSRAIGDVWLSGTHEKPGVIHKPKITVGQLEINDLLIIACDGLKDFVLEEEIIKVIDDFTDHKKEDKSKNLAYRLVDFAINNKKSQDNVTVLAIEVC